MYIYLHICEPRDSTSVLKSLSTEYITFRLLETCRNKASKYVYVCIPITLPSLELF